VNDSGVGGEWRTSIFWGKWVVVKMRKLGVGMEAFFATLGVETMLTVHDEINEMSAMDFLFTFVHWILIQHGIYSVVMAIAASTSPFPFSIQKEHSTSSAHSSRGRFLHLALTPLLAAEGFFTETFGFLTPSAPLLISLLLFKYSSTKPSTLPLSCLGFLEVPLANRSLRFIPVECSEW